MSRKFRDRVECIRQEIRSLSNGMRSPKNIKHPKAFQRLTTATCVAVFYLVGSRDPARIGAERNHSSADDVDSRIPSPDARGRKPFSHRIKSLMTILKSIYGMIALPKSACLISYAVVTVFTCVITYILVFNLGTSTSWGWHATFSEN